MKRTFRAGEFTPCIGEERQKVKKDFPELGLWVCENHNEAITHIHKAIQNKILPFSKIKLLHFDAHPDLMFPVDQPADICFEKRTLYNTLSIADWILPLVYERHVDTVIWMKPPWATQIKTGKFHSVVGKDKESGGLRVTCKENYFLEEMLYSDEKDLDMQTNLSLHVIEVPTAPQIETTDVVIKDANSDISSKEVKEHSVSDKPTTKQDEYKCGTLCTSLISMNETYILDIDLDFFSTQNPFQMMFDQSEQLQLKDLFHFQDPVDQSQEGVEECAQKRKLQLKTLETSYNHFTMYHLTRPAEAFVKITCDEHCLPQVDHPQLAHRYIELMKAYCIRMGNSVYTADIDLEMIHFFGLCGKLPHHISSEEEIQELLNCVKAILKRLPDPAMITLARSTEDDYTPQDQVEFIQEKLLGMLKDIYPELTIHKSYIEE